MRTTLDIDDDVLEAVKERALAEKKSAGRVLSELARLAILGPEPASEGTLGGFGEVQQMEMQAYWPTFQHGTDQPRRITTNAMIERIQDELDREEVERANGLALGRTGKGEAG